MSQPSPSGKRILSIDGGGFRGLGCLLAIEAITNAAHALCRDHGSPALRPCEIFDLMFGSSTGGLLVVLLGRLGLDCKTAIEEYKILAQNLFGNDRNAFLDVVTSKAELSSKAYEDALADLILRHGGNKDLPFLTPDATPGSNTQTAVITQVKTSTNAQLARSWTASSNNWLTRDIARQTTAADIYLSPFQRELNGKVEAYVDAAYSGFINPSLLGDQQLWERTERDVLVSIGQWFSTIAITGMKPTRSPSDKDAKPFIPELFSNYALNSSTDVVALSVVKKVLQQAGKTVDIDTRLSKTGNYYRVDPPLGIGKWELVDHFCPDLEANVKQWLASPEGKKLVNEVASKLVISRPQKLVETPEPSEQQKPLENPKPSERPKPANPAEMTPPPAPEGTHKPNSACEKPRPSTMFEYLQNYHVIFVIDDSSSMVMMEGRWEEAREALRPIADYALQCKADTIDMHFINSPRVCTAVKDSNFILDVFDAEIPPNPFTNGRTKWYETPTGHCLQRILDDALDQLDSAIGNPTVYQQIKPFDIVLLTDGDPSDDPLAKSTLENAWARLQANMHHPNYVGVQIVQIGNSPKATAKLKDLMSGNIGSIVDTTPYNGVVTSEKLQRILLGAVQPNIRALYS